MKNILTALLISTIFVGCAAKTGSGEGETAGCIKPSKKYGNAVQRNLFRRRARSLYRSLVAQKKNSFGLIVKPLKTNISYKTLGLSFDALDKELMQTNKC